MKVIKSILIIVALSLMIIGCNDREKKAEINENLEAVIDSEKEKESVVGVMKKYKDAIQNLTTEGTFELFTPMAKVFEQGKVEGTYNDYINNHLGPELGHFKSFNFSNYKIDAKVVLPYAFTTETYNYTIVLKADETKKTKERTIESIGVATSILEKFDGEWKIINSHSSFKKINQ